MSQPLPRPLPLAAVPSLQEVQANPSILARIPLNVLAELRRQVRHLDADLDAAITRLTAHDQHQQPNVPKIVDVNKAAKLLGTSPDSLYRKRKRLRLGYMDPLDRKLKFTEQEIGEYIQRHRQD